MNYDECRAKISIIDIAEELGYIKISGPNATNLTYVLGNPRNPDDEIVIFPQKNTYFSRRRGFNDKGELTKFILNRLSMFPNCTQPGYKGVNQVLAIYLNGETTATRSTSTSTGSQNIPNYKREFNISYWDPQPIKRDNAYLLQRRKLSQNTLADFGNKIFIYTVGKHNHIAFPFRKPGQMEIVNFEMRNYFPANNTNYKAFATGGDKTQSCWIANFVPFSEVTDVCLFESAIDAMSFYEINHFTNRTTCAFISTGGYVTKKQIESLAKVFPTSKVKWHCCFDKDGSGNGFDVTTAYYLTGEDCKAFKRPTENGNMVFISLPNGESFSWKEDDFSSVEFLKSKGKDNVVDVIKPIKYKDWNELLIYYKRFDLNLGPGMKFIPAFEETVSQLSLRGYEQLVESIKNSRKELFENLLQQNPYSISAPLAESNAYTLMVDCTISMGFESMVPVPSNIYIIDKTTNKSIPGLAMNESLKKEHINIFKDLHSSDLKKLLEKHTLAVNKGGVEKNFERVISPSGWNLIESAPLKKKDLDFAQDL